MKKFTLPTLLCLITLLFFSCSTDSDSLKTTDESTHSSELQSKSLTGNKKIDDLYAAMLSSEEYKDAKEARVAFVSKMKFKGKVDDINTSAKMLSWIDNNLASTNFNSLLEAQQELDSVNILSQKSYNANIELYETVNQQPNPIQLWNTLLEPASVVVPDPCGCIAQLVSNLAVSRQYYSEALNEAYNGTGGTVAEAEACYEAMIIQDGETADECFANC